MAREPVTVLQLKLVVVEPIAAPGEAIGVPLPFTISTLSVDVDGVLTRNAAICPIQAVLTPNVAAVEYVPVLPTKKSAPPHVVRRLVLPAVIANEFSCTKEFDQLLIVVPPLAVIPAKSRSLAYVVVTFPDAAERPTVPLESVVFVASNGLEAAMPLYSYICMPMDTLALALHDRLVSVPAAIL